MFRVCDELHEALIYEANAIGSTPSPYSSAFRWRASAKHQVKQTLILVKKMTAIFILAMGILTVYRGMIFGRGPTGTIRSGLIYCTL